MKPIIVLSVCVSFCLGGRIPLNPDHSSGRIIGGNDADVGQFPYIVSYHLKDEYRCAGAIINKNFVVTAGSCCDSVDPFDITLKAGTNRLDEGGDEFKVKEIYLHPEFNYSRYDINNDICLLRLRWSIEENDLIQLIPLNEDEDDSAQEAVVAGWGLNDIELPPPNLLQWLSTNIVPHQECVDAWGNEALYPIRESVVCSFAKEGQGACAGDFGAPLVTYDKDGSPILTGLLSWGMPCAVGFPDVNTKVASYKKWIDSVINSEQ